MSKNSPEWEDAFWHESVYRENPELYGLMALRERVQPWQQVRILFQLLRSSRDQMSLTTRGLLKRITDYLQAILEPDQVVTVFLALRRERANHKHTRKAILNYILNHPQLEDLAIARRPAVADCLEHAMGKTVARQCARMLGSSTADEKYLHRHLWKFARNRDLVAKIFPLLYQKGINSISQGNYKSVNVVYREKLEKSEERPKTVTVTNRGDIAATLVHIYRGGKSQDLLDAMGVYVEKAGAKLPKIKGKIALVLDASTSTRGYGDREFALISQAVALEMVLKTNCEQLQTVYVGGEGYPPIPQGSTDLAMALLKALEDKPDVVAIASDGYENADGGDLKMVVEALPGAGITTPIVFCHSKFSYADDLSLRNPVPNLEQLEFWHQEDFEELMLSLLCKLPGTNRADLQEFLQQKLTKKEKELSLWTAIN